MNILFTVKSPAHEIGRRRYAARDRSRNNEFLAFITFGEARYNRDGRPMAGAPGSIGL
jgi:fatty-acid desaturase